MHPFRNDTAKEKHFAGSGNFLTSALDGVIANGKKRSEREYLANLALTPKSEFASEKKKKSS